MICQSVYRSKNIIIVVVKKKFHDYHITLILFFPMQNALLLLCLCLSFKILNDAKQEIVKLNDDSIETSNSTIIEGKYIDAI